MAGFAIGTRVRFLSYSRHYGRTGVVVAKPADAEEDPGAVEWVQLDGPGDVAAVRESAMFVVALNENEIHLT